MAFNGSYYYQTETFMITDHDHPEKTYERAHQCATKRDGHVYEVVERNGDLIGYQVRSRHRVGTREDAFPDKVRDGEHKQKTE